MDNLATDGTTIDVIKSPEKFVTVLQVNNLTVRRVDNKDLPSKPSNVYTEEVTIYRLPGERLGMGLKFDGGSNVTECINSLFVQSITPDSPASRARCRRGGGLIEGDMILQIEGKDVSKMTRLDCVSVLRDAPVALKILVQRINGPEVPCIADVPELLSNGKCDFVREGKLIPPPVPDRNKRLGIRLSPQLERAVKLSRVSGRGPGVVGTGEDVDCLLELPVEADVYMDLIAEEDKMMNEYESDETGSSASTVIAVANGTFFGDQTPPATSDMFDLAQVLSPFEQLEHEMELDMALTEGPRLERHSGPRPAPIEPPDNFKDIAGSRSLEESSRRDKNAAVSAKEGFVLKERKKFENLIENAAILTTTTTQKPRIGRPKKPPPPPPPTPPAPTRNGTIEFVPPPVPPRSKDQSPGDNKSTKGKRTQSTEDLRRNCGASGDDRLQAVQFWLEASVIPQQLANQENDEEVVRGGEKVEETRAEATTTKTTLMMMMMTQVNVEKEVDDGKEEEETTTLGTSSGGVTGKEKSQSDEVQRNLGESISLSRLPPDGHEFPPTFHDPVSARLHLDCDCPSPPSPTLTSPSPSPRRVLQQEEEFGNFSNNNNSTESQSSEGLILQFKEPRIQSPVLVVGTPLSTPDETGSVDTLDSAVDCDLNDSDHSISSPKKSGDDGRRRFSTSSEKEPEMSKGMRKFYARNIDEKNIMSLQEKIAMFSHLEVSQKGVRKSMNGTSKLNGSTEGKECQRVDELGNLSEKTDNVKTADRFSSSVVEKRKSALDSSPTKSTDMRRYTISSRPSEHLLKPSSSSLYSLLETRRQHISKLRGLVIPDKPDRKGSASVNLPLPTIKSIDSVAPTYATLPRKYPEHHHSFASADGDDETEGAYLSTPPWKDSNLPKYSPAFKRKSLSVVQTTGSRPRSSTAPQLSSSDVGITTPADLWRKTLSQNPVQSSNDAREKQLPVSLNKTLPIDTSADSEDKDSVISSSGSFLSQSMSPPVSPHRDEENMRSSPVSCKSTDDDLVEEYVVIRIPEALILDEKEVKTSPSMRTEKRIVDTLNRRNVLEQAKHSRGSYLDGKRQEEEEVEVDNQDPPVPERKHSYQEYFVEETVCQNAPPTVGNNRSSYHQQVYANNMAEDTSFRNRSASETNCDSALSILQTNLKPRHSSQQKATPVTMKSFRALTEQWEQRAQDAPVPTRRASLPPQAVIAEQMTKQKTISTRSSAVAVQLDSNCKSVERKETTFQVCKVVEAQPRSPKKSSEPPVRQDHGRMSSQDSTASESELFVPIHHRSGNSLSSNACDQYGSITSLASSTSLISPQELQQLLDEANQSLEESGTPQHEIIVVVLHREIPGGSIGITLAGGADYEAKEITVHKVIGGSLADRDGRIQKGDRILSINGKNVKGITHREALNILKAPRPECVLVLSRNNLNPQDESSADLLASRKSPSLGLLMQDINQGKSRKKRSMFAVELMKDASGVGFSLDGGRDSPAGDKPLAIKKIFQGGSAEKQGSLKIGDEVISVNGIDVSNMARIEAWNLIKKQPLGKTTIVVRQST